MTTDQMNNSHKEKSPYVKFLILLAIFLGYFGYLTYKFDFLTGGIASLLTWSFFVCCTPVADAGVLLDFPIRLLFGVRMFISECFVWLVAVFINLITFYFAEQYYQTTAITKLFHEIIITPYPHWGVVILSVIGTFLSVAIGDTLVDIFHYKHDKQKRKPYMKKAAWLFVGFIAIFGIYLWLLSSIGIDISTVTD